MHKSDVDNITPYFGYPCYKKSTIEHTKLPNDR